MSKLWSESIQGIKAYVTGEQLDDKSYIKLNANENPYAPSKKAIECINNSNNEGLRLYPDKDANELKSEIAKLYKVEKDQVFVGNGSDEVLSFSFMAFYNKEKPVLFPDITFGLYKVISNIFKIPYKEIPLNDDFSIEVDEYCKNNNGVVIANPNAHTGIYLDILSIKRILEKNKDFVVIIDEAYIAFGGESCVSLIDKYPNVLVIKTMSKSRSLAGLRVGYAIGNKELIQGLNIVKNSFNSFTLDRLALAGAIGSVKDNDYFETCVTNIIKTREELIVKLKSLGFNMTNSKGNFLFISHKNINARELVEYLKTNGILVRHFNDNRMAKYIRVSIGTKEDMVKFYNYTKEFLNIC